MEKNNSGSFWSGLVIGIIIMIIFNHPQIDGKTAQEWKDSYDGSQQTLNNIGNCLSNKASQWDFIYSKYSYDSIYSFNYSSPTKIADNGWIYYGFNINSITSPTNDMKNCYSQNN